MTTLAATYRFFITAPTHDELEMLAGDLEVRIDDLVSEMSEKHEITGRYVDAEELTDEEDE